MNQVEKGISQSNYTKEEILTAIDILYGKNLEFSHEEMSAFFNGIGQINKDSKFYKENAHFAEIIIDCTSVIKANSEYNNVLVPKLYGVIKWDDACKIAGLDKNIDFPEKKYKYFAYKNGQAKEFPSKTDAISYSKNYESVVSNEDEIKDFQIEYCKKNSIASMILNLSLRKEHEHLPENVFNKVYELAYEEGHSAGHDEVTQCMIDYVDLAEVVMKDSSGKIRALEDALANANKKLLKVSCANTIEDVKAIFAPDVELEASQVKSKPKMK